jgi:hypothetical protein
MWELIWAYFVSKLSSLKKLDFSRLDVNGSGIGSYGGYRSEWELNLLRWVNHLVAGSSVRVSSFGADLADGSALLSLLLRLSHFQTRSAVNCVVGPAAPSAECRTAAPGQKLSLFGKVVMLADSIGIPRTILPDELASGSWRICMCFVAQLFLSAPLSGYPATDIDAIKETAGKEKPEFYNAESSPVRRILSSVTDDSETKVFIVKEEAKLLSEDYELRLKKALVERKEVMKAQVHLALNRSSSGQQDSPVDDNCIIPKKYASLESNCNGVIHDIIDIRLKSPHLQPSSFHFSFNGSRVAVDVDEDTGAGISEADLADAPFGKGRLSSAELEIQRVELMNLFTKAPVANKSSDKPALRTGNGNGVASRDEITLSVNEAAAESSVAGPVKWNVVESPELQLPTDRNYHVEQEPTHELEFSVSPSSLLAQRSAVSEDVKDDFDRIDAPSELSGSTTFGVLERRLDMPSVPLDKSRSRVSFTVSEAPPLKKAKSAVKVLRKEKVEASKSAVHPSTGPPTSSTLVSSPTKAAKLPTLPITSTSPTKAVKTPTPLNRPTSPNRTAARRESVGRFALEAENEILQAAERRESCIYIGNLPLGATPADLKKFFEVRHVEVVDAFVRRGFGFVVINPDQCSVRNVVNTLDGVSFGAHKRIKLEVSRHSSFENFETSKRSDVLQSATASLNEVPFDVPGVVGSDALGTSVVLSHDNGSGKEDSSCIYIGNLSKDVSEDTLRVLFESYGFFVTQVLLKGSFAFVYFDGGVDVNCVIDLLNGVRLGKNGNRAKLGKCFQFPEKSPTLLKPSRSSDTVSPSQEVSVQPPLKSDADRGPEGMGQERPAKKGESQHIECLHVSRLPKWPTADRIHALFSSAGYELMTQMTAIKRSYCFVYIDAEKYDVEEVIARMASAEYTDTAGVSPLPRNKGDPLALCVRRSSKYEHRQGNNSEDKPSVEQVPQNTGRDAGIDVTKPSQVLLMRVVHRKLKNDLDPAKLTSSATNPLNLNEAISECINKFNLFIGYDCVLKSSLKSARNKYAFLLMSSVDVAVRVLNEFNHLEVFSDSRTGNFVRLEYADSPSANSFAAKCLLNDSAANRGLSVANQEFAVPSLNLGYDSIPTGSTDPVLSGALKMGGAPISHLRISDALPPSAPTSRTSLSVSASPLLYADSERALHLQREHSHSIHRLSVEAAKRKEDSDLRLQRRLEQRRSLNSATPTPALTPPPTEIQSLVPPKANLQIVFDMTGSIDKSQSVGSSVRPSASTPFSILSPFTPQASKRYDEDFDSSVFQGAIEDIIAFVTDHPVPDAVSQEQQSSVNVLEACGRRISSDIFAPVDLVRDASVQVGYDGGLVDMIGCSQNVNSENDPPTMKVFAVGHKLTNLDVCFLCAMEKESVLCVPKPLVYVASVCSSDVLQATESRGSRRVSRAVTHSAVINSLTDSRAKQASMMVMDKGTVPCDLLQQCLQKSDGTNLGQCADLVVLHFDDYSECADKEVCRTHRIKRLCFC